MNAFLITTISTSAMILIAAVFRWLFAKRLHKRTFPVLWALITLRLMIPLPIGIPVLPAAIEIEPLIQTVDLDPAGGLPELVITSVPAVSDIQNIAIRDHTPVTPESIPEISPAPPAGQPEQVSAHTALPIIPMIWMIWMIGIIPIALYFVISYIRCMRLFSESLPVSGHAYIEKWLPEHGLQRKYTVRNLDGIISPLTYGIFKPVILLPGNYEELSDEELSIILTHEFIHIKRFDAAFKLALTAVLCVYWFDPFVWLMYILANRDIEFSCDEAVLSALGDKEKQQYARTLLKMEELKSDLAPTITNFGRNILKERIILIMKFKKPTALTTALSALLVLGIGSMAAFAAAPKTEETVPEPDPAVTASEPVSGNNSSDNTSESPEIETPENSEIGEPDPVIIETLHNTELIPLRWEDGLETQPEGYYIELQKTGENGEKIKRYIPISETFDSDFAGKYEELLGDDYKLLSIGLCGSSGRYTSSRVYVPKDLPTKDWQANSIMVTFPPVRVVTYGSRDEILYPEHSNECSFEYHDDGSITVYYYNYGKEPLDFENSKPREPVHYTHMEEVEGGFIAW